MSGRANRTIYVGNLPLDIRESEVEDLFYKYGRIMEIELKNPPRPPGYCFVEFESSRDADDAIRGRDGYNFDGHRLRVELAHGGRGHSSSFGRGSSYGSGGGSKYGASHRSEYRVIVRGLPSAASWQDLKDHMRKAGDVCFAQVFRDRDAFTARKKTLAAHPYCQPPSLSLFSTSAATPHQAAPPPSPCRNHPNSLPVSRPSLCLQIYKRKSQSHQVFTAESLDLPIFKPPQPNHPQNNTQIPKIQAELHFYFRVSSTPSFQALFPSPKPLPS